jgi:hypothetical protein
MPIDLRLHVRSPILGERPRLRPFTGGVEESGEAVAE